jgi:hypothetical protein
MAKSKRTINVTLTAADRELLAAQQTGLTAFCVNPARPEQVLGSAPFDDKGKASVPVEAVEPDLARLRVIVAPVKRLEAIKRLPHAMADVVFKAGEKTAHLEIEIMDAVLKSVDWLNETFIVHGQLVCRYTDPETNAVAEKPVPQAKVKMFEVDKHQHGPCFPNTCLVCIPSTCLVHCTPTTCLPETVCQPAIFCRPIRELTEICVPETLCKVRPGEPECRVLEPQPWDRFGDIRERVERVVGGPMLRAAPMPAAAEKLLPGYRTLLPARSPALRDWSGYLSPYFPGTYYTKDQLGGDADTNNDGYFSFSFKRSDFFEAGAGTTHTENKDWDEWPDLLFQATRWLNGELRTIYSEPYSETRWDQHGMPWPIWPMPLPYPPLPYPLPPWPPYTGVRHIRVKLVINGLLPGIDPEDDDIDPNQTEDFLFHGVGNVDYAWITNNGQVDHQGHTFHDHVFGGTLDIEGQFKQAHVPNGYYQVQYRPDGSTTWKTIQDEAWEYTHYLGNGQWETLVKAPQTIGSEAGLYKIPDYTDFTTTRKTLLLRLDSAKRDGNVARYPNGPHHFRVRLFKLVGGNLQEETNLAPANQLLHVRLDNGWPEAEFDLYEGTLTGTTMNLKEVRACGFVQDGSETRLVTTGANRFLIIKFRAYDPEQHFRYYSFTLNRGTDQAIGLPQGSQPSVSGLTLVPASAVYSSLTDNYPQAYTWLSLNKDPYNASVDFKACAYNIRLITGDRVTNGDGHLHWTEYQSTLTIVNP